MRRLMLQYSMFNVKVEINLNLKLNPKYNDLKTKTKHPFNIKIIFDTAKSKDLNTMLAIFFNLFIYFFCCCGCC